MYKNKKVTAIITAAGSGSRMGANVPKQFLEIGGITVLERAIEPFQTLVECRWIIVTAGKDHLNTCRALCSRFLKVRKIIAGGKERQDLGEKRPERHRRRTGADSRRSETLCDRRDHKGCDVAGL